MHQTILFFNILMLALRCTFHDSHQIAFLFFSCSAYNDRKLDSAAYGTNFVIFYVNY